MNASNQNMSNTNRIWKICTGCNYQSLARYFNPANDLCKVCDGKLQAKSSIFIASDKTLQSDNNQAIDDMGLERDVFFDIDGNEIDQADLADHTIFFDFEGNECEGPDQSAQLSSRIVSRDLGTKASTSAQLEAAATEFLARAEKRAAEDAAKPRKPLTVNQFAALKRLGHQAEDIKTLSIDEASKLLQRGPKWLWK